MKSLFALALITALSFGSASYAQETTSSTNGGTKNFRFDPIPLIIGGVSLHLDFAVADQWTIGPTLFVWNFDNDFDDNATEEYEISMFSAGVRGNWFKNGVYTDGLYVGPTVSYYNLEASVTNTGGGSSSDGKANGVLVGAVVGYGWFWSSFNQMLGAGLVTSIGNSDATVTDSNGDEEDVDTHRTGFSFEYTLGWTF